MNYKYINILKFIVSISLLTYIISKVHWGDFHNSVKESNYFLILLGIIISFLIIWVMSYKWNILLRVNNYKVSTIRLVIITMITSFLGLFLPSSFSTDVLRGYYLTKEKSSKLLSASSIVIDRLSGISSLLAIALIGFYFSSELLNIDILKEVIIGLSFFILFTILFFLNNKIANRIIHFMDNGNNIFNKLKNFYISLLEFKKYPIVLFFSFLLSLIVQILRVLRFYVIAVAIGINMEVFYFFLIVPLIMLAIMLPITLGGFGIKEGVAVSFFVLIGISLNDSIVITLIESITMTFVVLLGGVLYMFYKPSDNSIDARKYE